jgi:hypothetical protein
MQQLRISAAGLTARSVSNGGDVEARIQERGLKDKNVIGIPDLAKVQSLQLVVGVLLLPYTGITQVASELPPRL